MSLGAALKQVAIIKPGMKLPRAVNKQNKQSTLRQEKQTSALKTGAKPIRQPIVVKVPKVVVPRQSISLVSHPSNHSTNSALQTAAIIAGTNCALPNSTITYPSTWLHIMLGNPSHPNHAEVSELLQCYEKGWMEEEKFTKVLQTLLF